MAFTKTDFNKNIYYVQDMPLLEAKQKSCRKTEIWNKCFICKKQFQVGDIEYKFRFLDGNIKDTTDWGECTFNYTDALSCWNKLCEDCITKQIDRIKIWSIALEQFYMRVKR
jgi:hypothetical protein